MLPQTIPRIEQVWDLVLNDLPWCDQVRILVGPLASRGTIKEYLLHKTTGIPSAAVVGLEDFTREILIRTNTPVPDTLQGPSRVDALAALAQDLGFRKAYPELARALRSRRIAKKLASFVTRFDHSWFDFEQCEAQLDAISQREGERFALQKQLLEALLVFWKRGIFWPWSPAEQFRQATERVEEYAGGLEKNLHIVCWGFPQWNEVEKKFISTLTAQKKIQFTYLTPASVAPLADRVALWKTHSPYDELECLYDELSELSVKIKSWTNAAIVLPRDSVFRQRVIERLRSWNVPFREAQPANTWQSYTATTKWRHIFEALASQLDPELVMPLLSTENRKYELFVAVLKSGRGRGHRIWKEIAAETKDSSLELLLYLNAAFARSLTPDEILTVFIEAQEKFTAKTELDWSVAQEFCEYLLAERPLLRESRLRVPKIRVLFDEFLETWGRRNATRAKDNLWLYDAGAWLDRGFDCVIVLNANEVFDARDKIPTSDPWNTETLSAQVAGLPLEAMEIQWEESQKNQRTLLWKSLLTSDKLVLSSYTADKRELDIPDSLPAVVTRSGPHACAGWWPISPRERVRRVPVEAGTAYECVDADAVAAYLKDGRIRVTAFEDYVKCPRLFYERHIKKNEPLPSLELEADQRVRGEILHAVLEQLTRKRMNGTWSLPTEITDEVRSFVREIVTAKTHEKLQNRVRSRQYAHPVLAVPMIDDLSERTLSWLRWEVERALSNPSLTPKLVEYRFELPLDTALRLIGTMDRVDTDGKLAVIMDYKTGKPRFSGKDIRSGLGVQLAAYASAVEEQGLEPIATYYLGISRHETKIQGGLFCKPFNKKHFKVGPTSKGIVDNQSLSEVLEEIRQPWLIKSKELRMGSFTANPLDATQECRKCGYRPICGFRESS